MNDEHTTLTENQIQGDIKKGTPFLSTLSRSRAIRLLIAERGYTNEVHRTGWSLLYQVMSHQRPWLPDNEAMVTPQASAMAELDRLDNLYFAYARACIETRYPEQASFLFKNLQVGVGPESILNFKAYVERLQSMREGSNPYRDEMREADRAAVERLESRNVAGAEVEARILALVDQAMDVVPDEDADPYLMDTAAYQALAWEFHTWLKDWRDTAKVAVTGRRARIRLGLARFRRKRKPAAETTPEPSAESPAPDPAQPTTAPASTESSPAQPAPAPGESSPAPAGSSPSSNNGNSCDSQGGAS